MATKSIVFIEPKATGLHIYSRYCLPRLGNILLATLAKRAGYKVRVLFHDEQEVYAENIKCDIAAISTITATAPQAYRIADYFRSRGILVVMGGPHVSFLPEEALLHADFCVLGEGEYTFMEFLQKLDTQGDFSEIPNLAFRKNGVITINCSRSPVAELDNLPFPELSLVEYGKKMIFAKMSKKLTIPIQTSRGCPFDCTFCSVTGMFGKRYRFRTTQNVIQELQQYNPKKHVIFFYDDNFAANRRHTKELLQSMIDHKMNFHWSTQVRTDIAKDPELLDLMYRAGCRFLYIGLESVDPNALAEMKKSQSVDDIRQAIRTIHARGIYIHGMFVFGFEADTPETVKSTVRFAVEEGLGSAQFLILTPLPGSEFYNKMKKENRLIPSTWDQFDAHHVAFQPKGFSVDGLQQAQIMA
ncbi:MAG: radical SAM protein, partial [Spirochaetaceae bacterium]